MDPRIHRNKSTQYRCWTEKIRKKPPRGNEFFETFPNGGCDKFQNIVKSQRALQEQSFEKGFHSNVGGGHLRLQYGIEFESCIMSHIIRTTIQNPRATRLYSIRI